MNRRDAISGLLASAAVVTTSRAFPEQGKPYRIATLPDFPSAIRDFLPDAMREFGWTEGRDFVVVSASAFYGPMHHH